MEGKANPWVFGRERIARGSTKRVETRGKGGRVAKRSRQIRVCATASIKVAGRLAARNIRADILTEGSRNSRLADKQRAVAGRRRSAANRDSRAIPFRLQQSANSRCKYFPADRGEETDGRIRLARFVHQPLVFPSLSSTFLFRYHAFSFACLFVLFDFSFAFVLKIYRKYNGWNKNRKGKRQNFFLFHPPFVFGITTFALPSY